MLENENGDDFTGTPKNAGEILVVASGLASTIFYLVENIPLIFSESQKAVGN